MMVEVLRARGPMISAAPRSGRGTRMKMVLGGSDEMKGTPRFWWENLDIDVTRNGGHIAA